MYPCSYCDRKFKTKRGILSHVGMIHPERVMRKCDLCGKKFRINATNRNQKTCSFSCHAKLQWKKGVFKRRRKKKISCDYCDKTILKDQGQLKKQKHFFCSYKCKGLWQKDNLKGKNNPNYGNKYSEEARKKIGNRKYIYGKLRSEATKQKISEALKIKYASGEAVPWNKGKHLSEEHKQNIGDARRGKCMGSDAPNWRGGTSFEPYGSEFTEELKEKIRERDSYQCQICGKDQDMEINENGCKLSVHHKNGDKKDNREANLVTLCKSCHSKVTTGVIQI